MSTTEQGNPAAGRARELQPADNGSVFGRSLHGVLDAPHGVKTGGDLRVPGWLCEASPDVVVRWLRTLVSVRGTAVDADRHGYPVLLRAERRGEAWWSGLQTQMHRVCRADTATRTTNGLFLRPEAAAVLDESPTLPALDG